MATPTRTPPDLNTRLSEARAGAETLRRELGAAEVELSKALEREDYPAAERAKQAAAEVRPHLALAEAEVKALTEAMAALDAHRQAEQAAAQRQAMEAQARANHQAAQAAAQQAGEDMRRHYAEAKAGIEAVRASLQAAVMAERAVTASNQAAYQALVDLGEREPTRYVSGPNWATAQIDRSQVLTAILHNRDV